MKILHLGTCLSDYFRGFSGAWFCIDLYKNLRFGDLKKLVLQDWDFNTDHLGFHYPEINRLTSDQIELAVNKLFVGIDLRKNFYMCDYKNLDTDCCEYVQAFFAIEFDED